MTIYSFLAIPIGYLLGSIPSAYIIGRLIGKIDLRTEGDGRVSAAAVKKRLGLVPFLIVVVMDVCKGILAVVFAKLLVNSPTVHDLALEPLTIVLATGFIAVVGHSWSPFIRFQGGLGATVIYGVLCGAVFWPQELIALVVGGITVVITRKSGFSTGVIIAVLVIVLLIQKIVWLPDMSLILVVYPVILIMIMVAKRFQVRKTSGAAPQGLFQSWKDNS
jgi:glycerol-3-phosphate acyltransferase PlsY